MPSYWRSFPEAGARSTRHSPIWILGAFRGMPARSKRLIWITGPDHALIAERTSGMQDVLLFAHYHEIDRLMVAADVAITKTNRKTVFELRSLNVPTIAVTYGLNPPDDTGCRFAAGRGAA